MKDPGEILCNVHTKEHETADTFNLNTTDVDRLVFFSVLISIVHYRFLCFADVEREVVLTPDI